MIAETYYGNNHFVWCAPKFNAEGTNPPSSDPCFIFDELHVDVRRKDGHSSKIKSNRAGLIKGASEKLNQGIITKSDFDDIVVIAESAQIADFRPLIYVIPYDKVSSIVEPVSIQSKAHVFSKEFLIKDLKREHFDIIDIIKSI